MEKVFVVEPKGMNANASEWLRVSSLPEDELPILSDEDRRIASLRRMTDLQYRRHRALRTMASERERRDGEMLGAQIEDFLWHHFGKGFRLLNLKKVGLQAHWVAEVADWGATGPRKIEIAFTEVLMSKPVDDLIAYFRNVLGVEHLQERKAG